MAIDVLNSGILIASMKRAQKPKRNAKSELTGTIDLRCRIVVLLAAHVYCRPGRSISVASESVTVASATTAGGRMHVGSYCC